MSEDSEDLLGGYHEESVEHLAVLEEKLLLLEKGNASKDDINSAFRSIHTVKGGSGFFGLKTIGSMAHVMEDLLGQYRAGTQEISAAGCDALLEGYEKLLACFEDLSSSEEIDISKPLSAIKKILSGNDAPAEQQIQTDKTSDSTIVEHPFASIPATVLPGYWIQFNLNESNAADIVENLASVGEVLETIPKVIAEAKDKLEVLFTTVLEPSLLEDVIPKPVFMHPFENLKGSPTQHAPKQTNASILTPEAVTQNAEEEPISIIESTPKKEDAASNKKKTKNNISIRVDFDQLSKLINLSGELILSRNQFINKLAGPQLDEFIAMSKQISELQEGLMKTRMQPLSVVTAGFPRLVRNLAKQLDKKVELKVIGEDIELDRNILEGISAPFTHILRNSLDHGIESPEERHKVGKPQAGKITVYAYQRGGYVTIEVKDDGKGIDPEKIKSIAIKKGVLKQSEADLLSNKQAISLIYAPGFSTAEKVTAVSGRGVGMDVVKTDFEKLGGTVDLDSTFGHGTTLTIQLPLSVAIIQSIIVDVAGELYALPRNNIREVVILDSFEERKALEQLHGSDVLRHRKMLLPVVNMGTVLGAKRTFVADETIIEDQREHLADRRAPDRREPELERRKEQRITIIIMNIGEDQYGLVVDKVSHQEETVVKNLNQILNQLDHFMGVTILSSGKVCFILDNQGFVKLANITFKQKSFATNAEGEKAAQHSQDSAEDYLLFESAPGERVALLAGLIQKAAVANMSEVMVSKNQKFITNNGVDYKLVFLHEALELSAFECKEEFYYVIPKYSSIPFAFVASKICGIHTVSNNLELVGVAEKGKIGTVVYDSKLLTVLDLYALEDIYFSGHLIRSTTKLGGVKHVLVVEDALVFRKILKGYLEEMGVRCDMAKHGKEALGLLESSNYDLVISDIEMPVMDGYELIQQIREKEEFKYLPVIALTSLVSEDNRQKGLALGFNDYLVKTDKKGFVSGIYKSLLGSESPVPALAEIS